MRKILPIVALVSLLMIGFLPTVEAPNYGSPRWDIVYDVGGVNAYPENEDWSRESIGTTARAIEYHNQLLNITMTGAGTDYELYKMSVPDSSFLFAEARFDMSTGVQPTLEFNNTIDTENLAHIVISASSIEIAIYDPNVGAVKQSIHYEEDIIGENHTYAFAVFSTMTQTVLQAYYDGNLIFETSVNGDLKFNQFWWESRDSGGGTHYQSWDYVAIATNDLTNKIEDLEDEIDDLKRELERLRKRISDIDTGYTDYTPNAPHIPYGARDFLDDTGNVLIDPFATWIYEIVDQQGSSNSNAHWLPYPSSASDVQVLSDRIEWSSASGTQIWINDTTPSIIFSTTDTGYESWDIFANNFTDAGANITFEMASDNTVSTRFVRIKIVDTFDWSVNTETQLHSTTVSLTNDWGVDARQLQVFIASDPDTSIDQSTVEIKDNTNNIILESGINYIVTASGFLWQVQHFNSSDQVSYTIQYNIYTPSTQVLEISCQVAGPRVTTAFWRNTKYQFTTASCYNPNTFDSTGRVVFDWQLIQDDVDYDGIVILDATGKRYTDIYPLTNKKIAVEDVFIPMSETVIFDIYFRTLPTEPDLARWFVQFGFWIPAIFFVAAIIAVVPLMAKEQFVEGTNIRIDKDRRKFLRRLTLSFLFIFVGTLIAWTFAVSLYPI